MQQANVLEHEVIIAQRGNQNHVMNAHGVLEPGKTCFPNVVPPLSIVNRHSNMRYDFHGVH